MPVFPKNRGERAFVMSGGKMKGLFFGVTIDKAKQWTNKKTGEINVSTPAVIGGQPVDLPGNGLAPMTNVFVFGDLRTYDRRSFFDRDTPVTIIPAQPGQTIDDVVALLNETGPAK